MDIKFARAVMKSVTEKQVLIFMSPKIWTTFILQVQACHQRDELPFEEKLLISIKSPAERATENCNPLCATALISKIQVSAVTDFQLCFHIHPCPHPHDSGHIPKDLLENQTVNQTGSPIWKTRRTPWTFSLCCQTGKRVLLSIHYSMVVFLMHHTLVTVSCSGSILQHHITYVCMSY